MLQDAMNRHDIDAILQMFTDDALFEIDARPPWVGHAQIREILEYDAAVHGKLRFINCISEGDVVTGELLEQNDRLAAIGIETLRYSSCRLAFHEGRIQRFSAVREAAGAQGVATPGRRSSPGWPRTTPPTACGCSRRRGGSSKTAKMERGWCCCSGSGGKGSGRSAGPSIKRATMAKVLGGRHTVPLEKVIRGVAKNGRL